VPADREVARQRRDAVTVVHRAFVGRGLGGVDTTFLELIIPHQPAAQARAALACAAGWLSLEYRMMKRAIFALFLAIFSIGPAAAQTKRPITVEDLWKVQRLGKPAISPNGKWVAVEVTSYSMEDNSSTSDLWLFSTDGKTRRQLTTFKGKNSGPAWSP